MKYTYNCLYTFLLLLGFLNTIHAQFERKLPGVYGRAVYRKTDGKIYAMGVDAGAIPVKGFLARIDPRTTSVEKLADLPDTFITLTLSSDETYLYIGADSIHRFNLDLKKYDQHFGPQFTSTEQQQCYGIVSIPGQDDSIVAFWSAITERTVAVAYAKGVRYGNVLEGNSLGRGVTTNGKNLYFFESPSEYAPILQVGLDANGPKLLNNKYSYILGVLGRPNVIQYDKERLYCSDGAVAQIQDPETLALLGRLDIRSSYMVMAPYDKLDTIYAQVLRGKEIWLQKFHRNNFQLLAEELLSSINTDRNTIDWILPLGSPREVAVFASGELYLVNRCTPQYLQAPALEKSVYPACPGDTLRISASGNFPADRYFWTNGFRGKTLVHPVSTGNLLKLSYRIADDQGCMSAASKPSEIQYVHFVTPPPQVQSRFDQAVICAGGELELSVVETDARYERYQQYQWSNGQTGRTIKVKQPGSYSCRIQSKEGCYTGFSPVFQVKNAISPQPGKPVLTIEGGDGDLAICSSDSASIRTIEGFELYIWSDNQQGKGNRRPLPLKGETLAVRVKNSAGCISEASEVLNWSYSNTPPRPFIQRSSDLLASSSAEGNQWFLNGQAIPGATQRYIKIAEKGTYTVQVVKSPACPSLLSEPFIAN